ncbi:hypothetical protein AVEN_56355-1 [Araneus ventricosus]|uniref:Uncharacterized protein n=1 Tax=Araneus ventricosus TaxID=182803 RepID=A0A4Y2LQS4_ARAVE|nr:hypothetical protein AVEN_56355-1 [Araneus ventricosus]
MRIHSSRFPHRPSERAEDEPLEVGEEAPSEDARQSFHARVVQLLELGHLGRDVLEDVLPVPLVGRQLVRHVQHVPALPDEVLDVLVRALVGQLRQPRLLRAERLVQVEELEGRLLQLPEGRGEHLSGEREHGTVKHFVFIGVFTVLPPREKPRAGLPQVDESKRGGKRDQLVYPGLVEIKSLPTEPVLDSCFPPLSEEKLVPYKCSFNFEKRKQSLGHYEAIQRKRTGMLSDGVILLHDSIHTARKIQELLRSSGKSRANPHTDQSGFQTLIWNKIPFRD